MMGAGHAHAAPTTASGRHQWRLALCFGLIASFFVVELITGLVTGSLALLSDAGHMAADVVTLGAALVATRIAIRPDKTGRRSYGSYRAEIFASLLAVLIMIGLAAYVIIAAVGRIGDTATGQTTELQSGPMLIVGVLGLLINLVALLLLRSGAGESLNVKGAYLEVIADTVGSVGVIIAAVLVLITGSAWWDTIIALAIGIFVAVRAVLLGRQVLAVLGQQVPDGLDAETVAGDLAGIDGVGDVHDLHLWTLTSGMNVATAHLVTTTGADAHAVLDRARDVLRDRHGVAHATLQVEPADHRGCDELGW